MSKVPFILLVNPWITDFAAHDLWAKPMGLLLLGALLKDGGCGVAFIDCLDRHDSFTNRQPGVLPSKSGEFGTGKYSKMRMDKPEAFAGVPRRYYRHGIHPESFTGQLRALPRPDLVWVTSAMTYWYPGVVETIAVLKEAFPDVPVWLGGIYARLCSSHAAQKSGADEIVTCPTAFLPQRIEAATGFRLKNARRWSRFEAWPGPALELLPRLDYAPLLTGLGCPYRCPYCASAVLNPEWAKRGAESVYQEITALCEGGMIRDFAFYDDALLLHAETNLKPVLYRLVKEERPIRFHTPNALHVRALDTEWCALLRAAGFTTIRLGLETTRQDRQKEWGGKVETQMFVRAVDNLLSAGFPAGRIGAYLLCGVPGQRPEDVADSIRLVKRLGIRPHLAEYSPVPGTLMWREAVASSAFDIENEPLYHNNTFFACRRTDFTWEDLRHLKDLALGRVPFGSGETGEGFQPEAGKQGMGVEPGKGSPG
ncbi:MAG: radical SAM protein [Syntrophobacteraceae bacterium]|nr:radical SAM protein [Syntrophobacteraceae bacterium]